jgi:hypothetical protein
MNIIYLKDGTKANLITKTDKGYVVDPYQSYHDYETKDEYEEPSGNIMLVDKVYESAPMNVIEEEYKQTLLKLEEQRGALTIVRNACQKAEHELEIIKRQKTDLSKLIINRKELKEAKRLIVWIKGQIAPRIMDSTNRLKLTISYTISQYNSEEKCWAYSCWDDCDQRWSSYSEYFDPEYGIKTDLTDEEILSITHDRQRNNEYDSHAINRTDEKWLTPENLEKKKEFDLNRNERDLIAAENELLKIQERIDRLRSKTLQIA